MRMIVCETIGLAVPPPDGKSTCLYQDKFGDWKILTVEIQGGVVVDQEIQNIPGSGSDHSIRMAFRAVQESGVEEFLFRLGTTTLIEIAEVIRNFLGDAFEVVIPDSPQVFPVPLE